MDKKEVPWLWHGTGKEVTDEMIPEWAVAYVYVITHWVNGRYIIYVGKKQLTSSKRSRIGVREKKSTKTRKTYKVTKRTSNWKEYWGSSAEVKAARETGEGTWYRQILQWCHSKKHATYCELSHQFRLKVLEIESYNGNINGSIYRKDLINPKVDG